MAKKSFFSKLLLIPLGIGIITSILYFFPFWESMENGVFDLFLHMKPAITEEPKIICLNVDDYSIINVGSWPWPRGVMAQGLETLAEFGGEYAIFDIEYLEKSPSSVDRYFLNNGLNREFDSQFSDIQSNMSDLFSGIANKSIPLSDANDYASMLASMIDDIKKDLYEKTKLVAVENDTYLGKAMRLFGNAFVTLNKQEEKITTQTESLKELAKNRFALTNLIDHTERKPKFSNLLIPIEEISKLANNAGFTNVEPDSDGVRRRIVLVDKVDGTYYAQLAFRPLLDILGNPTIELFNGKLVLKGANLKGVIQDISIPIDSQNNMLVNWPPKQFKDSFTHVSFYKLIEYRQNEEQMLSILKNIESNEAWKLIPGDNPTSAVINLYKIADDLRLSALESGEKKDKDAYVNAKKDFFNALQNYFTTDFITQINTELDKLKEQNSKNAEYLDLLEKTQTRLTTLFENAKTTMTILSDAHKELDQKLKGSISIIGWSATTTTDIGVNPFDSKYINIGTHASVINTIMQKSFLSESPLWISMVLSLFLSLGLILLVRNLKPAQQMIVGGATAVGLFFLAFGIFLVSGIYIAILSPIISVFASFILYSIIGFLISEREKSFLRKAFSTYLSGDVISEMMQDPTLLKLGGQKKHISAMFTDVKGFSTVSEKLSPENLVQLLNVYLSAMSDIILENKGTIDKFEGDAIISFFGAPLNVPTHARETCYSAIRMKQKEIELNEKFMKDGLSPTPLLTRIGINTGDMVVGNMGTERKMDYTIMGNAVNLAARLEGVNKQYGSWILASDATYQETGDEFLVRRFDRVRVVGISTPVQLYELLAVKSEADSDLLEFIHNFEKAHLLFEDRDYVNSADAFKKLLEIRPNDGPSQTYLRRSEEFKIKAPAQSWDGVFSLTEK